MVRESVTIEPTWYAWRFKMEHTPENDERVEEWCYIHGRRWIVSREHGDKSGKAHYQGALMAEVSKFILHQSIKKYLEVSDRDFSCKPCRKPETYFSYLTKEEVMVWNCDTPQEEVKDWVSKSEYKKTLKPPSRESFMDRMIKDFDKEREGIEGDILPVSIYEWVCAYFVKHAKIHDRFIIDRHANVLVALNAGFYRNLQVTRWAAEWSAYSNFDNKFDR